MEGFGIYATVLAVFQTASIGCALGLPSFIPRELSKDISQTNRYLIHTSLIALLTAVFMIGVLRLLVPYLNYLPQTKFGIYIINLF